MVTSTGKTTAANTGRGRLALPPPPRQSDFSDRLRNEAVTARVGVWLGVCFTICFLTGVWSHYGQEIPGWLTWPTSPSWGYRVTQGLHVTTGAAAVPLLLVKLWSVYPRLFQDVPRRPPRTVLLHLLERGSVGVLVAAAVFQLATGLMNSSQWYPWEFSFRSTHYAIAWLAIGSLAVHIAVKLPVIKRAITGPLDGPGPPDPPASGAGRDAGGGEDARHQPALTAGGISRRGLLRTTWAAAGLAVVTSAAAGTVPWLRELSVFGVRSGEGPQGVPINRTAETAGAQTAAQDPAWRLTLVNGDDTVELSRDDLVAMPQHTASLPISCVEGWSASAVWTGVRVADVLAEVGAPAGSDVFVTSLQTVGSFATSELPANVAAHPDTLLALQLHGEDLHIDHGYPCRIIAPNRPGVRQTKWVSRMEVLA